MSTMGQSTPGPEDNVIVADAPPAPGTHEGIGVLIRKNLFKDVKNSLITIFFGLLLGYAIYKAVGFVFFNQKATPDGGTRNAWVVIRDQLEFYMVGTEFQRTGIGFGRIWAAIYVVAFAMGLAGGKVAGDDSPEMSLKSRAGIVGPPLFGALVLCSMAKTFTPVILTLGIAVPFIVGNRMTRFMSEGMLAKKGQILALLGLLAFLLEAGYSPAGPSEFFGIQGALDNVDSYGGLLLTVNVAFISIILCFPIGVVLALVRRSTFALLRPVSVIYIELIRGVPLITLLFMGEFAIGFFFPPSVSTPPSVIRAIIMFTLFSAAYVAEIVRGGLQSVPPGQTEAGQAVGLQPLTITRRIVLPQALRNSIPALVGQFIALLKDTTLLIIISQFDLLGVSDPILASPEFQNQGYAAEVYAFVAFVFWIICFAMSRASQRLETKLGVGNR